MSSLNAVKDTFKLFNIFLQKCTENKETEHVIHPPFVKVSLSHRIRDTTYTTLQSGHVKCTPQDCINEFIIRRLNPSVVVDLHSCIRNEQ